MFADTPTLNYETLRPRIAPAARFVDLGGSVLFLSGGRHGECIKLTPEEAAIARSFDGRRTLPDLLQEQMETCGSLRFRATLNLVNTLNDAGLLYDGNTEPPAPAPHTLNPVFTTGGARGWVGLIAGPLLFGLCGGWGLFLMSGAQGLSILRGFHLRPGADELDTLLSYGTAFAVFWCTLSLVLSLKNLFSACVLKRFGCAILRPRLALQKGLLVFACEPDEIITAGKPAIAHLFIGRMLIPAAMILPLAACSGFSGIGPLAANAALACLVLFLVSVSPLFRSDLTLLTYFTTASGAGGPDVFRFLRRHFVRVLFSKGGSTTVQDYYLLMSSAALVWLYGVYALFWKTITFSFASLAADFLSGGPFLKLFTVCCFVLLTMPLFAILIEVLAIGLTNADAVSGCPWRRLMWAGKRLARSTVPDSAEVAGFLKHIPLFAMLNEQELHELIPKFRFVRVAPKRAVVEQGERGDSFYCVVSGNLRVVEEDVSGAERQVAELGPGDSFGEIALLENVPRTATVATVSRVTLMELSRKDFNGFVERSAFGADKVTGIIRIRRLLMKSPVLSALPPKQMNRLVGLLKPESKRDGEIILRQGDEGDRFYIITSGEVTVDRSEGGISPKRLATLKRGDFFGEIALIKNVPRTATLTASGPVELLYLTRQEFYDVLRSNLAAGAGLDDIAHARLQKAGGAS